MKRERFSFNHIVAAANQHQLVARRPLSRPQQHISVCRTLDIMGELGGRIAFLEIPPQQTCF
jgi:hypothetical protein